MRRYAFILMLLIPLSVVSQSDWFPVGAKWHYTVFPFQAFPASPVSYTLLEVSKDTIINGKNCAKIFIGYDASMNCFVEEPAVYLYELNDKVYSYNSYSDTFHLLYNFNAQQGDQWTIKLPCDSIYYPWWQGDSIIVNIDSVSSININGNNLKVLHTNTLGKIVERIGMVDRPFPELISCTGVVIEGCASELRCYEDSVIGFYHNTPEIACDSIYNLNVQEIQLSRFQIYPNPATSKIWIETNFHFEYLEIYDINGKKLVKKQLSATKQTIDISHLSPGIYFIEVRAANKNYRQKLIKL